MPRSTRTDRTRRRRWPLVALVLLGLVGAGGWFGLRWAADRYELVLPFSDHCAATVNGMSATVTPHQAEFTAIITGEAQRRQLAPRAASIAIATAYQESGIRNLEHGDRDSVGLFQQRPSQGWGTEQQILDPWYASGRFYDALVKVPDWQNADLNDIAQKVQISAHPEAYRKHVTKSRALASSLTGETPATFGCLVTSSVPADTASATAFLKRVFGDRIKVSVNGAQLTVTGSKADVWSAASLSVANASTTGLRSARIGSSGWTAAATTWSGPVTDATTATLTFGD